MSSYKELREQVVQQVVRGLPNPPPLDRIRAQFDACFFQINSTVAEAFAAVDTKRELLRIPKTVTLASGLGTLSSDVLKKYIEDGTFAFSGVYYTYLPYPNFIRAFDRRLGYWTVRGETIQARKPTTGAVLTGDADTTFICSPEVPTGENSTFNAPDDYLPDLLGAITEFIRGLPQETAAQTA